MRNFEPFYDVLKQLIRTPSVVGAEYPFFLTLKRELEEIGIQTTLYEGILVARGEWPNQGYISAHIDRHGLICTGPNEFQYAAFISKNRGDLIGSSVSEQTYKDLEGRFVNQRVQAYNACSGAYLGVGEIRNSYLCERRGNLIFEIKGLEYLMPNTPVAFLDKLTFENGFFSAQLDNVLSAAMIIYLYQIGYQGTAFFTAEEEAGKSWRYLLEWFRRFDKTDNRLLVLDTSPYPDIESLKKQHLVFRNRDANAVFNSPLHQQLEKICDRKGITYSYKDRYIEEKNRLAMSENSPKSSYGSTELGRLIMASEGNLQGATLQVPTIGYHTINETASEKSVISAIEVLKALYLEE